MGKAGNSKTGLICTITKDVLYMIGRMGDPIAMSAEFYNWESLGDFAEKGLIIGFEPDSSSEYKVVASPGMSTKARMDSMFTLDATAGYYYASVTPIDCHQMAGYTNVTTCFVHSEQHYKDFKNMLNGFFITDENNKYGFYAIRETANFAHVSATLDWWEKFLTFIMQMQGSYCEVVLNLNNMRRESYVKYYCQDASLQGRQTMMFKEVDKRLSKFEKELSSPYKKS